MTERWQTVGVAPLAPGWRNLFRIDGAVSAEPCPALLLQELREVTYSHETLDPTTGSKFRVVSETVACEAPFETRTVFADFGDGHLDPALDVSNYCGTVGPGESLDAIAAQSAQRGAA
jgi:hypothetical protein